LPALRKARVPVRWTDLTVRHTGYVDVALRARKLERDIRLLRVDLEDHPNDPFILFNLGAIAVERRDGHEALGYLERSLAGSVPTDSIVRKLFALIARSHQMLGDTREALRACARGLELDPDDAELWFRKAVVHRHRGESAQADQSWRRILSLHRPNEFCSLDQGIFGHLTLRNLAALAAERGDQADVERLWQQVLAECPGDREALAKLEHIKTIRPRRNEAEHFRQTEPDIIRG
jgi:tetratricopeptide (TPR) repeat protein